MTLKEMLQERYAEVKKISPITSDFETFYNNESRKLTDILNLLQIEEWTEKLKSKGEYNFPKKWTDFVSSIFNEYSGKDAKLEAIRRGDFSKVDPMFVERLYYGFMEMFCEAGASYKELSQIDLALQESLHADFYIAKARYDRARAKLDEFFEKPNMSDISDNAEFLKHFAFEFERRSEHFIKIMAEIAEAMDGIRDEELTDSDRLNEELAKISPEEKVRLKLSFAYSDKIESAKANDEPLKNLKRRLATLQNPGSKKRPFQSKIKKQKEELMAKISEREKEIETRTIEEEHTKTLHDLNFINKNERFTLPEIKNPYTPSPVNTMPSLDVLLLALQRLKEDD